MADPVKFTFKRKSEAPVKLQCAKNGDEDTTEYISNADEIPQRPSKRKKKLVITATKNLWQPGSGIVIDDVTKEAIDQILEDPNSVPAAKNKNINPTNTNDKTSSLKFPGVVPQIESTLEDYEDVPISDFGAALMRGMGWEKGKGVGRNRKVVEPLDFEKKKRTLGVTVHEEELAEADRLFHEFKLGDYVELIGGNDKGKHAKVLSLSLETSRCIVRLPSDEMIDVAIIGIKPGSREEYYKLRDSAAVVEDNVFAAPDVKKSAKKLKKYNPETNKDDRKILLHSDLKVRIVSKDFLSGKYYLKKVDIVDITDDSTCVCRTEKGKLLESVPQSILETVIPKKHGSLVMLLSKQNQFEIAELEEKDSKSGVVICLTLIEKDVITVKFEEVCQYVGDVVR